MGTVNAVEISMFGIDVFHLRRVRWFFALTFVLFLGCGGKGESGDVDEIVDVEERIEVDTSEDQQAVPRAPQLVGILPQGFPDDLPLYLPASLIDFGTHEDRRTVTLITPHELSKVQPAYEDLLVKAGWVLNRIDSGLELSKGARMVRMRWLDEDPGSTYLLEY